MSCPFPFHLILGQPMKESMTEPLCRAAEVTETGREVMLRLPGGPRFLMLFRRGEVLLAYENVCPHQGMNLNWAPDRFMFSDDGLLICAHHGACFDLDTGECTQGPCKGLRLKPVAVSLRDDQVWLTAETVT